MKGRPSHYEDRAVAQAYHRRYARGWARLKHDRKLAILRRWIGAQRPSRVLDVACGPARFRAAYEDSPSVALDRSREMLDEYRALHPRADLVRGDASNLPFRSGSFDVVLCTRFLSHLRGTYRARVLEELSRVSRGVVILDGRHRYNLRYLSRWIRRRLGLAQADKLRHSYGDFRRELEAAGLEVERIRSIGWGLSARFVILGRSREGARSDMP